MTRSPSTPWSWKFRATGATLIFSLLLQNSIAFAEDTRGKAPHEGSDNPEILVDPRASFEVVGLEACTSWCQENRGRTEIPLDMNRALKGVRFMENYRAIGEALYEMGALELEWIETLKAQRGEAAFRELLLKNDTTLTVFKFGDGTIGYGSELSDKNRIKAFAAAHGGLDYRIEPTTIDVFDAVLVPREGRSPKIKKVLRKEIVLKMIDHKATRDVFILFDPARVPLDNEHLERYGLRQAVEGGKSDGLRGRNRWMAAVSFDVLRDRTGADSLLLAEPVFKDKAKLTFLETFQSYNVPILWPENVMEATFSTLLQLGTTAASTALVKLIMPDMPTDHLMFYFTIAFGMGVGIKGPLNRNWVNGAETTWDRVYRRSFLGVVFALSYSIAHKHGISHLNIFDLDGALNAGMLLSNVALAKLGSDAIQDLSKIRTAMRKNTKQVSFVPADGMESEGAKPLRLRLGGLAFTVPGVKVGPDKMYFTVPGLRERWDSRIKWQALEGSLFSIGASFSKLFDQIMMATVAAGGISKELTLAQSAGLLLLSKSFLFAQLYAGKRYVLHYAETRGYEHADVVREDYEAWFGKKAWGKRLQKAWLALGSPMTLAAAVFSGAKLLAEQGGSGVSRVASDTAEFCRMALHPKAR